MFDRIGFDQSQFNRQFVDDSPFYVGMKGNGDLTTNLYVRQRMSAGLSGSGQISGSLAVLTPIAFGDIGGTSAMTMSEMAFFKMEMSIPSMNGASSMKGELTVKTPIPATSMGGSGSITPPEVVLGLKVDGTLGGSSDLSASAILEALLETTMSGESTLYEKKGITLETRMAAFGMHGEGNLNPRRLIEKGVLLFELENITLNPRETITIDMDMLTVMFNNGIVDVSAVSSDSTFFELYPGDNVFKIYMSPLQFIQATVAWQNRWL